MTQFVRTMINGRWPLHLLPHRATRPEWPFWEAHTLALAYMLIKPGNIVWEVGAEEGDFPALYATWGAEVVLIEPNPHVWPQIKLHWQGNVAHEPLRSVVGLASDQTVSVEADYDTGFTGGWPNVASGEVKPDHGFRHIWEHASVSPQFRLDDLGLPIPDLITMDIEGGELHALRGMEETLRQHHPQLIVSIHDGFLRELYGLSSDDVLAFMDGLGYEHRHLCTDHEAHWWFW